jgi:tagatose-1,6-bisphosphate aldolase non-catalytic subunit AgaZ/GatZ
MADLKPEQLDAQPLLVAWRSLSLAERWRFLYAAPEVYAATESLVRNLEQRPGTGLRTMLALLDEDQEHSDG